MGEPGNSHFPTADNLRSSSDRGEHAKSSITRGNPELLKAIGQIELALLLIELDDFTVTAVSDAALKLVGMPPTAVVRHPVVDMIGSEDRINSLMALRAMQAGVIDFYRAHRRLGATSGSGTLATAWVRAVQFGDKRVALSELVDGTRPRPSPLVEYFGRDPLQMVIGAINSAWVITSMSSGISAVLGVPAKEFVGRPLLGSKKQRDLESLLDSGRLEAAKSSVSLQIQLKDAKDLPKPFCCVLTSLAGSADRLFVLISTSDLPAGRAPERISELEGHLWKIAAEVEASGILQGMGNLPDAARFPQTEGLSVRQWEILRRLIRGERVPTIAEALFVSRSTVRNHLSAIFKRFGVHSQAELLALLRNGQIA